MFKTIYAKTPLLKITDQSEGLQFECIVRAAILKRFDQNPTKPFLTRSYFFGRLPYRCWGTLLKGQVMCSLFWQERSMGGWLYWYTKRRADNLFKTCAGNNHDLSAPLRHGRPIWVFFFFFSELLAQANSVGPWLKRNKLIDFINLRRLLKDPGPFLPLNWTVYFHQQIKVTGNQVLMALGKIRNLILDIYCTCSFPWQMKSDIFSCLW